MFGVQFNRCHCRRGRRCSLRCHRHRKDFELSSRVTSFRRRWFYYYAQHIRFILLLLLFASWLDSYEMLAYFVWFFFFSLSALQYISSFIFESHACAHIIHPRVYGYIDGWLTFVICVVNVRRWTHTIYSFLVGLSPVSFWWQRAPARFLLSFQYKLGFSFPCKLRFALTESAFSFVASFLFGIYQWPLIWSLSLSLSQLDYYD